MGLNPDLNLAGRKDRGGGDAQSRGRPAATTPRAGRGARAAPGGAARWGAAIRAP
jgi:hypothetical protein